MFVLFRCGDDLVVCDRVYYTLLVVSLVVMRVLAVVSLWRVRVSFEERRVLLSAITVSFPLFSCLFSSLFVCEREAMKKGESFRPF